MNYWETPAWRAWQDREPSEPCCDQHRGTCTVLHCPCCASCRTVDDPAPMAEARTQMMSA